MSSLRLLHALRWHSTKPVAAVDSQALTVYYDILQVLPEGLDFVSSSRMLNAKKINVRLHLAKAV